MGTLGSFAVGAALGFLFMLAVAASALWRVVRRPRAAAGLERLAPDATGWQPLPAPGGQSVMRMWRGANGRLLVSAGGSPYGASWSDGRWETTTELPPRGVTHPTVPDTTWFHLAGDEWLTASAGGRAPVLEPSRVTLPPLPRCDAEQLQRRVRAAARTSTGDLLVVAEHTDGAMHGWRLAAGDVAWTDLGLLPITSTFVRLAPGFAGDVLAFSGGGDMARHDGQRWTALPPPTSQRIGWEAALAEDGAVLAGGGHDDTQPRDRRISTAITLALLVAAALAVALLDVTVLALVGGASVGVLASVAAFFAVWLAIAPRL